MKNFIHSLGSLRLAVVLLIFAMVLVYAGTWAQVDTGIYQVQKQYFHSWIARIDCGVFLPRTPTGGYKIPGFFPFPGGYTLGLLLLVNLVASQLTRVPFTWRRAGIHIAHLGVILLLIGEAWSSVGTIESHMQIREGESANYSDDFHLAELAVIDRTPADHDSIIAFGNSQLVPGKALGDPRLPFTARIEAFYTNAEILGPAQAAAMPASHAGQFPRATAGAGQTLTVLPRPSAPGKSDLPAALVTLFQGAEPLGTWLLGYLEPVTLPQEVKLPGGSTYYIQLRPKRYIKPYRIELIEFRHDVYPGTDRARNYSSRVRIIDPQRGVDREELIWMNHPLRYGGEVFYQASFVGDTVTVLQVVRNPAAVLPYIACIVGSLGLIMQFGLSLGGFLRRRSAALAPVESLLASQDSFRYRDRSIRGYVFAISLAAVLALWLAWRALPRQNDFAGPASLPILFDGRLQPLDSVARNSLRTISGRQTLKLDDGRTLDATTWLLDVLARPETAREYPVFLIENPDLVSAIGLDSAKKRFSSAELEAHRSNLESLYQQAASRPDTQQDLVQRKMLEFAARLNLYVRLSSWTDLLLVPPAEPQANWSTLADAAAIATQDGAMPPLAGAVMQLIQHHREGNAAAEVETLQRYHALLVNTPAAHVSRLRFETFFNRYEPFLVAMVLYLIAFILVISSWLLWPRPLLRAAFFTMAIALALHTAGLAARIYIQGRPPVTNLYSSSVFIGWFAILLALGIELIYRNGLCTLCASLCGFATLVIAHNLAASGDTMGALEAVLDSNFWLTTHVLAITCGYSAAFLAGLLGVVWLIGGTANARFITPLYRALYGVVCFAFIFSFVGTILGGIWADQSWGRFWGWDPKENGAVLIVLWLAIMLHARAGRLVRQRGFAVMALFANIVTAWSWFGTNMLGVGLHSYGFMSRALNWLLAWVILNLVLMLLAFFVHQPDEAR